MRYIITLALVFLQIIVPPLACARVNSRRPKRETAEELRRKGWTFLRNQHEWLVWIESEAHRDFHRLVRYDTTLANSWQLNAPLKMQFIGRAAQIETSENLRPLLGDSRHRGLVESLRKLSNLDVVDRGLRSDDRLNIARATVLKSLAGMTSTLKEVLKAN